MWELHRRANPGYDPRCKESTIYYLRFSGNGCAVLASDLDAEDPFGLEPGAIVGCIVAAGYTPAVKRPQTEPFRALGTVTEIEREGLATLVPISRDDEEIEVQERRADAYDSMERTRIRMKEGRSRRCPTSGSFLNVTVQPVDFYRIG